MTRLDNATQSSVPDSVPGRSHYSLEYFAGGRLFSYAHQLDSVVSFDPKTVLEIGVGGGVVTAGLRAMGIEVKTLDIQPELGPNIVGSVTDIPLPAGAVDVCLCSQVLEHLPFSELRPALSELGRVARDGMVMSLPDATPYYRCDIRLPRFRPKIREGTRQREPGEHYKSFKWEHDGHYWEIGYPEASLTTVEKQLVEVGWHIQKTWRVPELSYHRFFRLVKCTPKEEDR